MPVGCSSPHWGPGHSSIFSIMSFDDPEPTGVRTKRMKVDVCWLLVVWYWWTLRHGA